MFALCQEFHYFVQSKNPPSLSQMKGQKNIGRNIEFLGLLRADKNAFLSSIRFIGFLIFHSQDT
jgi:hypothetical protein